MPDRTMETCIFFIAPGSTAFNQLLASGEKLPGNVLRYYKFLSVQEKFSAVDSRVPNKARDAATSSRQEVTMDTGVWTHS